MTELLIGVGVLLAYLAWCWAYPWKPCPRCSGQSRFSDGSGNYRISECRRCGGKPYPRVGTRFIAKREG